MDINAILATLDVTSLVLGAVVGLIASIGFVLFTRYNMKKTFREALVAQKDGFDNTLSEMKSSFSSLSSEALTSSHKDFLNLANDKFEGQTERHENKLEEKEKLIDQQLEQMSETLKEVPDKLDQNQKNVSDVLDKSTMQLKESNQSYLSQLSDKAASQTKEHFTKLDDKETQINRRLGEMDQKLEKVQTLINEFEKARESKLGALDDQLKNLTQTTSSLQKALADNRARGQWGERMAEEILGLMGMIDGVHYHKQLTTSEGKRPDFTFPLPNQLSLNMDCKFPVDNYLKYVEADNDTERAEYSRNFLRNIEKHVTDITKRDYINAQTVDCVLIFIPNEQIYRFINEQDNSVIDTALKHKVILCSPITLYVVLAVIRQAARNFTIEQRSREIVAVVNEIRKEWEAKNKYTHEWEKLQGHLNNAQSTLLSLTTTRTNVLDRKFARIEGLLESNEMQKHEDAVLPQLPEETS